MPDMPNLETVKEKIEELAGQINAPKDLLPTYGSSRKDGIHHIEANGSFIDYWIVERDNVIEHSTAFTLDELLYRIFQNVTFEMALTYEKTHRNLKADFRRMLFEHQLEILSQLNPHWKEKKQAEVNDLLKHHPFVDQG